ncbi:MAG TPA: hemerythrin domain-containing protein [Jatrophihabitantaceae bacterium]|nr:hemerythrin domain-containing protein [Jatrophihabitantaceae bacterium]
MSRVSRRGLLVGGAGLLVGAGATELGERLGSSSPSAEPHVPSPGEELMVEHGVLKRVLLAYRAMSARLADGRPVPSGVVTDAAQIVSSYVESFHEGLEEAYVFPRVQDAEPELVRTLLVQHDRGRHLTAAILAAAGTGLHTAAARAALRTDLDAFVRMYEPHEAWEDTVVYPALRAATPQRTLDELAERFADLSDKQFGDHALRQILDRVAGVEQQLGIGDLASFTPAAD